MVEDFLDPNWQLPTTAPFPAGHVGSTLGDRYRDRMWVVPTTAELEAAIEHFVSPI